MIDRIGGGFKEYAPLMLRLGLATIFIIQGAYGITRLGRSPSTGDIVVMVLQLIGGLFCFIGFLTRWAAFGLGGLMVWEIIDGPQFHAFTHWDKQLYFALLVMCFALWGLGGGKYSLDDKQKKKES